MSILTISFILVVGILLMIALAAIIWTQIIRPDTNTEKLEKLTSYPLLKLKGVIKKISKQNQCIFYNVMLNKSELGLKANIFIPGIVITDKKIYLLSSPIYSTKDVTQKNGQYFWKGEDLKYDRWFDRTVLFLSKQLNISEEVFEQVIPSYKTPNKVKGIVSFENIKNNGIYFNSSKTSEEMFKRIKALNIINFKTKKWVRS